MPSAVLSQLTRRLRRVFEIDPRSLGLFRICLGLSLALDLVGQAGILGEMTTDAGSLPRALHRELYSPVVYWSLHLLGGSWAFEATLYAITFAALAAFIVGYRTRWATLVLWVLLVSLHNRHPLFGTASDMVRRLLLFWGFFLPLGCRFSLDERAGRSRVSGPIFSAATIAILLQVVFIYLGAAFSKDYDTWVRKGTATMLALRLDLFATHFGKALTEYPALVQWTSRYTWWIEHVMPFLALSPIHNGRMRLASIAAFLGLHAGLSLCLELGAFPSLMMAAWMLFLPPLFWSWLRTRTGWSSLALERTRRPEPRQSLDQAFVWLCLTLVVLWNVQTMGKLVSPGFPVFVRGESTKLVMRVLKLTQSWDVFAPHPSSTDGWLMVVAKLRDGSEVDLFRAGRPVDYAKPEHVLEVYENPRWAKYTNNLKTRAGTRHRPAYAAMHVRRWNERNPPSRHVEHLEIIYVSEKTLPDWSEGPLQQNVLWEGNFP